MSIRTRRAHRHARTHAVGFGIAGFFGFLALLVVALFVSLGLLVNDWLQDLPDYTSADAYLVAEPTTVYDADNNVIAEYYLQNRRSVSLDQVSDYVIKGIVDTEDVRFYQHNGVDPQGILRAVAVRLSGGSEGGSTITQQLVRNTVLSDEQFEQTLKRKVREAYIAIQMEKMYTKDQILNMYLNTIYFGHSAYGIQAASITYFNKDASDLTLAEAATLCGLPQSPSVYDPLVNPEAATERRNIVLDRMLDAGDITQEEHDAAQAEELVTNEGHFEDSLGTYPYFSDYVKQILLEDFDQDTIMQGGLSVYTTLDPDMQAAAEEAVTTNLDNMGNDELTAALVAIDPSNGYVRALVGGRDYSQNQYNLATQATRQTGSSFKAYTLVTAINEGMNPQIMINCNSPLQASPTWKVQNFSNASYGTISMASAFALSSNTGFVQVIQAVGADKVSEMATDMGIDVDIPAYDSITLGTIGVPVIQMAEGYATIASGGVHHESVVITRIEDRNGNTVYEHTDESNRVFSTAVADAVIEVMKGVCRGSGTASAISYSMTIDQPIAGKTGSTENLQDLWFCGITPQLSVAVWVGVGGDVEKTVTLGNGANGHPYSTTVPIFIDFMNAALAGVPRQEFPTTTETVTYKANSTWKFTAEPEEDDDEEDEEEEEEVVEEVVTTTTTTPETTTTETTAPETTTTETTTTTTTTTTPETPTPEPPTTETTEGGTGDGTG